MFYCIILHQYSQVKIHKDKIKTINSYTLDVTCINSENIFMNSVHGVRDNLIDLFGTMKETGTV